MSGIGIGNVDTIDGLDVVCQFGITLRCFKGKIRVDSFVFNTQLDL